MGRVGIVTDSTSDLPLETLAALDVKMVPLKVLIGDQTFLDWIEVTPDDFYDRLERSPVLPKTSQPSPAEFLAAYEELAAAGCESIVSIHLSAQLSGTMSSVLMACDQASVPVHVVDTKKVTQALGLVVKAAVEARDAGLNGEAVAQRAVAVSESMRLLFVLDTLEYLVKGGRAGKAQGIAASLLNIKPVLEVNADGIIEPFKKVKGRKKALTAIADQVARSARENGRLRLSLLHACTADRGAELLSELEATAADIEFESVGLVGAVVGTYTGRNAIGVAYYPID